MIYIPYDEINHNKTGIRLDFEKDPETAQGMPLYSVREIETVGNGGDNRLIRGDCLAACAWLKENDIQVDMVYIDPPFFSGANYKSKVYLRGKPRSTDGIEMMTYTDKWSQQQYLAWIYDRLRAIRSVMSERASIYVHLDWHICHYVKVILDEIFDEKNYINEIIWAYKSGGASQKSFSKKHDTIYLYAKNKGKHIFNPQKEKSYNRQFKPYRFKGVEEYRDAVGWYTMVNQKDIFEIDMVGRTAKERVDYITQKPEALVEKMIKASTDPGMIVADFFGGSGVTAAAAAKNGRRFISCDISRKSIQVTGDRLKHQSCDFTAYVIESGSEPAQSGEITTELIEQVGVSAVQITGYHHPDTEMIIKNDYDKKGKTLELSSSKIELIELISLSCDDTEVWHSDYEVRIMKNGKMMINEKLTDQIWQGEVICPFRPKRMLVRDICGEETVVQFGI